MLLLIMSILGLLMSTVLISQGVVGIVSPNSQGWGLGLAQAFVIVGFYLLLMSLSGIAVILLIKKYPKQAATVILATGIWQLPLFLWLAISSQDWKILFLLIWPVLLVRRGFLDWRGV